MRNLKAGIRNRRTTIGALLMAVSVLLRGLSYAFDADPSTVTDWNSVVESVSNIMFFAGAIWAALNSPDAKDDEAG